MGHKQKSKVQPAQMPPSLIVPVSYSREQVYSRGWYDGQQWIMSIVGAITQLVSDYECVRNLAFVNNGPETRAKLTKLVSKMREHGNHLVRVCNQLDGWHGSYIGKEDIFAFILHCQQLATKVDTFCAVVNGTNQAMEDLRRYIQSNARHPDLDALYAALSPMKRGAKGGPSAVTQYIAQRALEMEAELDHKWIIIGKRIVDDLNQREKLERLERKVLERLNRCHAPDGSWDNKLLSQCVRNAVRAMEKHGK